MQFTRIYVDSNVFIRAFEGAPEDAVARSLVNLFGLSGERALQAFVTSQLTLAEMLVHPIRTNHLTRQLQYKALLSASNNWLKVRPISRVVLVDAASLRVTQKLKLPDAIHLATAQHAECSHILTADKDFGDRSLAPTEASLTALHRWLSS